MLLLVTGASGVGKTSIRKLLEPHLTPEVECAELSDIAPNPPLQNLAWRQHTAELAIQRAVRLQREGRHLLLCGDPAAAIEVSATPTAPALEGIAFCLLDADPASQAARLRGRGDPPALLVHHQAFAQWMRDQATDPTHMLDVVATGGWPPMRWDRIARLASHWHVHTVDTTDLSPPAVAANVEAWIRRALAGREAGLGPALGQPWD